MELVDRLLADLVALPSVNPMGRAVDGPTFLESRVTEYLAAYFERLGVPYRRAEALPGRENLVARYEAPDAGRSRVLLFDAHQDTVPVDGMTIDPFRPEVRAGKLYGRGSCDVKGGLAAMLAAFTRLVRERPAGSASVILACTVDEEYTHRGSSLLASEGIDADLAVVAEPTMLDLVTCHKGAIRWKIRAGGVACHSSTPALGDNAIFRMARVATALDDYAATLAAATPHPVLGPPSLSVGRIAGGQSVNIVPDWCEVEIDRRVIPGEVAEDCPDRVREYLRGRLAPADLDRLAFGEPWVRMPALDAEASRRWLPELIPAVARGSGRTPRVGGVPFGTDAGPIARAGVPCVVLGPGDIAQAHTKDEWIDLDQVRTAADVYFEIARGLGRSARDA